MKKYDKIEVGHAYEAVQSILSVNFVFIVLGECVAKTVRFKKEEPGWKILILQVAECSDLKPGAVCEWVKGANVFTRAKRLD